MMKTPYELKQLTAIIHFVEVLHQTSDMKVEEVHIQKSQLMIGQNKVKIFP